MATIAILACSCVHDYQDKVYGKGHRVHNLTKSNTWRCSVCDKDKS